MASVLSLGQHRPAGMQQAVDELLLPTNAPASSYTWEITTDDAEDVGVEDELLTTKDCVIWSRGGTFRKSFKFGLEQEPITQALLAFFPAPESGGGSPGRDGLVEKDAKLSKALVVFLKTQAHIYFLSGASYVVHIPFEVECACSAPQGVIIQRKLRTGNTAPVSMRFPRVPPNSFVSSLVTTASVRSSRFSVEGIGNPKSLPLRLNSALDTLWDPPLAQPDTDWPRLACLTDPLLDLGLVVTGTSSKGRGNKHQGASKANHFLDPAEEILHIEEIQYPGSTKREHRLVLAVTLNRDATTYSVWELSYLQNNDPFIGSLKKAEMKADRRRTSMQPGHLSGAVTPTAPTFRESFGAPLPGKRQRKSEKPEKATDFVSSLDPDKERETGVTRRASRRVSSMLARADLSVSQDRPVFSEQVPSHGNSKRIDSHGSFLGRISGGGRGSLSYGQTLHPSLNSLLEAPFESHLDEGFDNMGLHDHEIDGLAQEILFKKITTVSADNANVRYSLSNQPARSHCRVFILVAPLFATEDGQPCPLLVCIQDPVEKRLQLLNLSVERIESRNRAGPKGSRKDKGGLEVKPGPLQSAQNVVDSCKIRDGNTTAILILSETMEGRRELSLQAPWNPLTTLSIPVLLLDDERSLHYRGRQVDRDIRQQKFESINFATSNMTGFRNARKHGIVDMVDGENRFHQLKIQLEPSSPQVRRVLDVCRSILPPNYAEKFTATWWHTMKWMREDGLQVTHGEWSCMVIQLLATFLALGRSKAAPTAAAFPPQRKRRGPSGSFGSIKDLDDWRTLQAYEAPNSSGCPAWMLNRGWQWAMDDALDDTKGGSEAGVPLTKFMAIHIRYAKLFLASPSGDSAVGTSGSLPTAISGSIKDRQSAARSIFMAIHLLLEEQKLDVMCGEHLSPGPTDLRVVMCQIARWLRWHDFVSLYELGIQEDLDPRMDLELVVEPAMMQPTIKFSVFEWIQSNLIGASASPPLTLADIYRRRNSTANLEASSNARWTCVTPRSIMFMNLFQKLKSSRSPAKFVETMHEVGIDSKIMETLPEAILIPIRDAIAACQAEPPATWSPELLELVNRSDISLVLRGGSQPPHQSSNVLTPAHQASWDFRMLCQSVDEYNNVGYDEGDGTERQAVIRALFKGDRRLNEAQELLSTHKARVVRLDPQPRWSESEYLERQKEFVSKIAIGTLAIPAGRAMLYYALRFPLLTQKFHVGGFNLNCTVRPTNVTVGVDKSLFTEEKVCWGFFHQGVAAGLAISPQAKGIDTSWILYNKPGQDLSNRHAGFLLALGLNGHLKHVAKWVAFKYLTPKHTMTSIGLLLGLAASYIGTMDSLITRLLSVHVTRMLPRGAAELNISPLTQTTGIMGIGLLYCNSQHRRMSEIMLSEIVHIDDEEEEEPLRSECYRLAAGFALGFINLGKGNDLKGLHDMKLTEQLITIATSPKKVEIVHVLDRAAAGAVMAIALIFMKSEDQIVARKIDVPDSVLQFDYIRPDILLLRTIAKNIVLWKQIEPSFAWITKNLPKPYRHRRTLVGVTALKSTDLPFFGIVAGLCFSIGLRYAGTASTKVRDLLVHYLDQFILIAHLPATPRADDEDQPIYDEELARSNARMCQDVLALSCSIVMAGTGDLIVLRRLRVLHGTSDPGTPYGSHLAAHLAIGALFLGCGTATFGTSDLAIACLLVAFYPIFPTSVMDNRSHLQAFRHFWVLATDPRCLVAKDVTTGQPISVPVHIRMKRPAENGNLPPANNTTIMRHTPCLLPPLSDIASVKTDASPAFWDVEVDFLAKPELVNSFRHNQSIYLRRRPAQEAPFTATLRALGREAIADGTTAGPDPLEWLFELGALRNLTHAERAMVLDRTEGGSAGESANSAVDARLVLERSTDGLSRDRLLGLKLLFDWADHRAGSTSTEDAGGDKTTASAPDEEEDGFRADSLWMRDSVIESLKGRVWLAGRDFQSGL